MTIIQIIFKIGVLLAIYGFIWFFINLLITLLMSGREKTLGEIYFSKGIKSVFLVNVLFLFGMDDQQSTIHIFNMIISGLILLMYFIGQMQKNQQQAVMIQKFPGVFRTMQANVKFNRKAEIVVFTIALSFYVFLFFFPTLAKNPVALWFYENVVSLEKTPIIGFIFKIVGFFFLLGILFKIINGIFFLISGKPFMQASSSFSAGKKRKNNDENDDSYDDYEEVKNELPEDKS
jgi:hypothetical protein